MKSNLKTQIIALLLATMKPKQRFNELLSSYMKNKDHNPGQASYYNRALYSVENLKLLIYDVKKLYGISDLNLKTAKVPVFNLGSKDADKAVLTGLAQLLALDIESDNKTYKDQQIIDLWEFSGLELPSAAPAFAGGAKGLKEMKNFLKENDAYKGETKMVECKEAIEVFVSERTEQAFVKAWDVLVAAQQQEKQSALAKKQLDDEDLKAKVFNLYENAEPNVKDAVKMRAEFSFLREADCPDKLKVLVADKFTALEAYENARVELKKGFAAGDGEKIFEVAAMAVKNWELNQLIYDELTYYQENNEILGNHPIFENEILQRNVDSYKTKELTKRRGNLRSYISRDVPKLEKMTGAALQKSEKKIQAWKVELDMIDKRLENE